MPRIVLAIALLLAPAGATAQGYFGFGVTRSTFQREPAAANAFSSVGGGIDMTGGATAWRYVVFGGDFGVYFHRDLQSQGVTTTGGEDQTSGHVYYISPMAGLQAPAIRLSGDPERARWLKAIVMVGRTFLDGSAGVTNCTNCPLREFDLDGGAFVEPSVALMFNRNIGLAASYRIILQGDQAAVFGVRIVVTPEKRARR